MSYANLLKYQPKDEDVFGETDWLWVKADTSSWPGPRVEWITEHAVKYYRYLTGRDTVVTAGANCGLHARFFAKTFRRVYAFEPDPLNFHCMVNNCQYDNVIKMMCALGDENRMVQIRHAGLEHCGSHRIIDSGQGDRNGVPMLTIDTFQMSSCDLIQLDVEGLEHRVLKGAVGTIRKFKPVITVETLQGVDYAEVTDIMAGLDYQRVDLSGSDSVWVAPH